MEKKVNKIFDYIKSQEWFEEFEKRRNEDRNENLLPKETLKKHITRLVKSGMAGIIVVGAFDWNRNDDIEKWGEISIDFDNWLKTI